MSFKLKIVRDLNVINSQGLLYEHDCGARLVHINNNDENRAFMVAFKTPPRDDSGVFHIIEHCVLCGSDRYPVKEPFSELLKSSLFTYLNAITFPDRTVYPLASVNENEFFKMMDVYLDGVFAPLLRKEVFLQEGLHYDVGERKYGGIVYNEMLGAYSDPAVVLKARAYRELFCSSSRRFDSAGTPEGILSVTYEGVLEDYRKYYDPGNAFFYVYGDLQIERVFHMVDGYLERVGTDGAVDGGVTAGGNCLCEGSECKEKAAVSVTYECDGVRYGGLYYKLPPVIDVATLAAVNVLDNYFLKMPGAPLKEAIYADGLCGEITSVLDTDARIPVYGLGLTQVNGDMRTVKTRIEAVLRGVLKDGLDKGRLDAAINKYAVEVAEEYYGYRPRGIQYGLDIMPHWMYFDRPFTALKRFDMADRLRKWPVERFASVIEGCLLADTVEGSGIADTAGKGSFAGLGDSIADFDLLKAYQHAADGAWPVKPLNLSEVAVRPERVVSHEDCVNGVKVICADVGAGDLVYVDLVFDTGSVPKRLLPYIGLLVKIIEDSGLSADVYRHAGGISAGFNVFTKADGSYSPKLVVSATVFKESLDRFFGFAERVIHGLGVGEGRIRPLAAEQLIKMERSFTVAGHLAAVERAKSYYSDAAAYTEHVRGLDFYRAVKSGLDEAEAALREAAACIFARENLCVFVCGGSADIMQAVKNGRRFAGFVEVLPTGSAEPARKILTFEKRGSEAIITSANVNFNACAFDFKRLGIEYSGKLTVLAAFLANEYLIPNIRHKGGAYDCGCRFTPDGDAYFFSYRDPNVAETFSVFEGCAEFLRSSEVSEDTLRQIVIGALNGVIKPVHAREKHNRLIYNYFSYEYYSGIECDNARREAEEIASVGRGDLKLLADMVETGLGQAGRCSVGNEENMDGFDVSML